MIMLVKGQKVLIDTEDWVWARKRKWSIMKSGKTNYCRETVGSCEMLHRIILGIPFKDSRKVDHINGNGLDCRRSNLRIADASENAHNLHHPQGDIPYMGVYRDRDKFRAQIRIRGKRKSIGSFPTPELAAMAYDRECRKHFGEFAPQINNKLLGRGVEGDESRVVPKILCSESEKTTLSSTEGDKD